VAAHARRGVSNARPRLGKGTAVFFAVGAVSGTVLSFELGLLFPGFMKFAGPLIGMPFSLEGFAFFTEAIFLGCISTAGSGCPSGCTSSPASWSR